MPNYGSSLHAVVRVRSSPKQKRNSGLNDSCSGAIGRSSAARLWGLYVILLLIRLFVLLSTVFLLDVLALR